VKGVPVQNVAIKKVDHLRSSEADALQVEIRQAHESMQSCFRDMDQILASTELDATALTSVRLKLAGIRLTRGPLISRIANALSGKIAAQEQAMLDELRSSHQRLLQTATTHTSKWTLDAIATNWSQYRTETRELIRQWQTKAEREQRLVYPLVQRCAGMS
jgi:hypothetical protein